MLTCLLSLFKSNSFGFGNQLKTSMKNIEKKIRIKLYNLYYFCLTITIALFHDLPNFVRKDIL